MNVNQETDGPVQPTLEQLDTWCEQALSSASSEAREEAERRLRYFFPTFSETQAELSDAYGISSGQERVLAVFPTIKGPADAARLMTWFLHQSAKVYSQTYVVRRLRTLVLNHLGVMADDQKSALRVSLLEAIREKGSEMPAFLVDDITRTLALVVMFTWFDMSESRDVIDQVLEGAVHRVLALQMLRAFVEEFNRELPARVAAIARASYERCAPVVLETLREMAAEYQEMLRTGQDVTVVELQLAWPVYAVALCISARQPYRSLPEDDRRDADMFATALELDRLVQQRIQSNISTPPCESLELALLQTHVAFRSSFIGEGGHKVTAVFAQLSSLVGLPDGAAVLDLILQKVLFNLRSWPAQSPVVHRSLQLFHDMTAGYVSVRQVAKLDTITLLLANHSSEQLQFLHSIDEYKQRALYYGGLARVLFASDTPSPAQFVEFMHPWTATVDELLEMPEEQLVQDAVRPNLIRVLRDLRGFLAAISSKNNFMRFFEWLMPQRIELVHRAVRMGRDSHVQIAGLKFLAEFAYNRTQRLNFDVSSANGILIFREASQAIWEYGRLAIDSREPVRNVYKERYKGVAVCFTTLMRLVAGKYVAIGVMPLYGD
ncbi:hypothetical protein GGH16_002673, partial [Coemansia sp. RSA 560]